MSKRPGMIHTTITDPDDPTNVIYAGVAPFLFLDPGVYPASCPDFPSVAWVNVTRDGAFYVTSDAGEVVAWERDGDLWRDRIDKDERPVRRIDLDGDVYWFADDDERVIPSDEPGVTAATMAGLAAVGVASRVEGTGGGCEALRIDLDATRYVYVTGLEANLPDGVWMRALIHDDVNDADPVFAYDGPHSVPSLILALTLAGVPALVDEDVTPSCEHAGPCSPLGDERTVCATYPR